MDFSYFFLGSFTIVLRAEDFKRFFSICTYHGIVFSKLHITDLEKENCQECTCRIRCDRYLKLQEIAQKTNVEIEILHKQGLPFWLAKIKLHIWFFAGAVMVLFLLISLSQRIWDIRFDGNCYYGNEKLERFLTEIHINSGMKTNEVDCAGLSAQIRENFPRVTWASAEIDGCKLIIHIKENELLEPEIETKIENSEQDAYDLIAEKDGMIEQIFVRNGISQVEVGQSVKKGEILISGNIPIMNDAMDIIAYENTVSDGDISIRCDYAYYDEIPRKHFVQKVIEEKNLPMIQIGTYRFSTIWVTRTEILEEYNQYLDEIIFEKKIKLTDSFELPLIIGKNRQIIYEKVAQNYTDSELQELANSRFREFYNNLEKKGVQIYQNSVKMEISDVSCTMSGKVSVIEQTGKLQLAKTIDSYGDEMEE